MFENGSKLVLNGLHVDMSMFVRLATILKICFSDSKN